MSFSSIILNYCIKKCHKVNPNHGGSYIDYPDWIKNKNFNDKYYTYSIKKYSIKYPIKNTLYCNYSTKKITNVSITLLQLR